MRGMDEAGTAYSSPYSRVPVRYRRFENALGCEQMSTSWFCIKLAKCHSSIGDVGVSADCEIGETANEALVVDGNFIVALVPTTPYDKT